MRCGYELARKIIVSMPDMAGKPQWVIDANTTYLSQARKPAIPEPYLSLIEQLAEANEHATA